MKRCKWCNLKNPLYIKYHDNEWGTPRFDDKYLLEMLILESFQAGLSWECILNKRKYFKECYDNFDINKIIKYDETKINELLNNPNIIRNKLKIKASINNTKIFKEIINEYGSFYNYLSFFLPANTIYENDKTTNYLSDNISKDLISRGMKFVGSTIIYSYLQAIGIINSHENTCYLSNIKDKISLRKEYLTIRKSIPNKNNKSDIIFNKLISLPIYKKSKTIALYYNLPSEVDTKKLIEYSLSNNKSVYLPVVINSYEMEFYKINNINEVTNKTSLGIYEPLKNNNILNKNNIDLIIIPGVCFDTNKNRIGFGSSYYDRYLSNINKAKKVAICFEEQILKNCYIKNNYNDIKMDLIITETNTYK